ncbi:MAG: hypothetical protein R6U10_00860 [Thermoplasmatota archaeon]
MNETVLISILAGIYVFTFASSTILVRNVVKYVGGRVGAQFADVGFVIGICENFIVITLVVANEFLALSIIFTAKALVRTKEITKNPQYYLVGTVVNFSYALFMGFIARYIIDIL